MRATVGLVVARCALALVGFQRVRRALDRTRVDVRREVTFAGAVRRAVARAARTVPGSNCLPQAIVATRLLRAAGLPAELVIGVARSGHPGRRLDAHAWVQSGDFVVTGDGDLSRYTPLGCSAAARRTPIATSVGTSA